MRASKVSVIGAGHVGSTFAYALLLSGLSSEVVLVDKDGKRAEGEALDLAHAVPFNRPAKVRAGSIADIAGSAITVIAAGANQHPGETRLDLLERNAGIVRGIAADIAHHNPDGVILVATNPVDVLARLAQQASGLPACRVIGSGTILDTARLRHLVGRHLRVDPRNVHAHVIGEHGDSSVVAWSSAMVGGVPLPEMARIRGVAFDEDVKLRLERETRGAAYAIVEGKGSTYYAIGSGLVRLAEAVLRDERSVLTVSNPFGADQDGHGVWLSLPAIIDRSGLAQTLPIALDDRETEALAGSADILREAWNRLA